MRVQNPTATIRASNISSTRAKAALVDRRFPARATKILAISVDSRGQCNYTINLHCHRLPFTIGTLHWACDVKVGSGGMTALAFPRHRC